MTRRHLSTANHPMHGHMLSTQQQREMQQMQCLGDRRALLAHLPEPLAHPSSDIWSLPSSVLDLAGSGDIKVAAISTALLRVEAPQNDPLECGRVCARDGSFQAVVMSSTTKVPSSDYDKLQDRKLYVNTSTSDSNRAQEGTGFENVTHPDLCSDVRGMPLVTGKSLAQPDLSGRDLN